VGTSIATALDGVIQLAENPAHPRHQVHRG